MLFGKKRKENPLSSDTLYYKFGKNGIFNPADRNLINTKNKLMIINIKLKMV